MTTSVAPSQTQYNSPRLHTAYWLGRKDAKDGASFAPEQYFARRDQMVAYARGYESIKTTESSRHFLRARGAK